MRKKHLDQLVEQRAVTRGPTMALLQLLAEHGDGFTACAV